MFDISIRSDGHHGVTVRLAGELRDDDARVRLITFVTRNCIDAAARSIVLQFDRLTHLDLETTLTLTGLEREARRRGKTLRISGANTEARQKLKGLGLLT